MTSLTEDLQTRMAPSPEQLAAADASDIADSCYTPICFPGKEYGIWTWGARVEHPDGVYSTREDASVAAALHMRGRRGTVGYTWHRDDRWSVFEDVLEPHRLIELSEQCRRGS